jgi:hypothetical protein
MFEIQKFVNGRVQKLTVECALGRIVAMRWRITADKFCPWLVSEGEELLPTNNIKRGLALSAFWRD